MNKKTKEDYAKFKMLTPMYTHCIVLIIPGKKKQIPYAHFWAEDKTMAKKIAGMYTRSLLALPRMKRLGVKKEHVRLVDLSKLKARRTK